MTRGRTRASALGLWLSMLLAVAGADADVSYTEEIVNAGAGGHGSRKTVHEVRIQGLRQRVETRIEASEPVRRALESRGTPLQGTEILRLDQRRLYQIDAGAGTYRAKALPAAAAADTTAAAKPATPGREITLRSKVLPDTMRIEGILCRRVAVEMRVTHYQPGTKTVQRRNRYLYQAWMAQDFAGFEEIAAFEAARQSCTALEPLIRGGLEQLAESVGDAESLELELEGLDGFPMTSELTVDSVVGSGDPKRVFQLTRRIVDLQHEPLPDTLFRPSRALKPLR